MSHERVLALDRQFEGAADPILKPETGIETKLICVVGHILVGVFVVHPVSFHDVYETPTSG